jgi:transcriptional regulator with XRE-family HTH domain
MAERALDLLTLSLADVAQASGVSHDTLKSWKRAKPVAPSVETAGKLADFMRKRAAELVEAAAQLDREASGGVR